MGTKKGQRRKTARRAYSPRRTKRTDFGIIPIWKKGRTVKVKGRYGRGPFTDAVLRKNGLFRFTGGEK